MERRYITPAEIKFIKRAILNSEDPKFHDYEWVGVFEGDYNVYSIEDSRDYLNEVLNDHNTYVGAEFMGIDLDNIKYLVLSMTATQLRRLIYKLTDEPENDLKSEEE